MDKPVAFSNRTDVDAFLYSIIWVDSGGLPLTVLSVLARENLDPWDEARALARSPRDAAVKRLSLLLASAVGSSAGQGDGLVLASRLLERLPRPGLISPRAAGAVAPIVARLVGHLKSISRSFIQSRRR